LENKEKIKEKINKNTASAKPREKNNWHVKQSDKSHNGKLLKNELITIPPGWPQSQEAPPSGWVRTPQLPHFITQTSAS
jgi:hypothetical protein